MHGTQDLLALAQERRLWPDLADLVATVFGQFLSKVQLLLTLLPQQATRRADTREQDPDLKSSRWDWQLNKRQQKFALLDAWLSITLFERLQRWDVYHLRVSEREARPEVGTPVFYKIKNRMHAAGRIHQHLSGLEGHWMGHNPPSQRDRGSIKARRSSTDVSWLIRTPRIGPGHLRQLRYKSSDHCVIELDHVESPDHKPAGYEQTLQHAPSGFLMLVRRKFLDTRPPQARHDTVNSPPPGPFRLSLDSADDDVGEFDSGAGNH